MNERNYGIDFLRLFSILMITTLHIIVPGIGQYAFYNGVPAIKIIYAICSCGVNCFLLISGYVNLKQNYKFSRIIKIIVDAIFYNLLLTIIIGLINNSLSIEKIINSLNVITNESWWFLRTYVLLFIAMPVINSAVNNLNKRLLSTSLFIFVFISIFGSLFGDYFYLGDGFSALWFIVVYTIGAYIRKYEDNINFNPIIAIVVFVISSAITTISFYLLYQYNGINLQSYISEDILFKYTSPTILINSIMLLLIFKKLIINRPMSRLISFVSPSIFSVYLIQCQHYIYQFYFPDYFSFLNKYNNKLLFIVPFFALIIVSLCILIDQIRIIIKKLTKIDKLYNFIDSKININK